MMPLLHLLALTMLQSGHQAQSRGPTPPETQYVYEEWSPLTAMTYSVSSYAITTHSNSVFTYSGTITDRDLWATYTSPTTIQTKSIGSLINHWDVDRHSGSLFYIPGQSSNNPNVNPTSDDTHTTTWTILSKVVDVRSYAIDNLTPVDDGGYFRPPATHLIWDTPGSAQSITITIES